MRVPPVLPRLVLPVSVIVALTLSGAGAAPAGAASTAPAGAAATAQAPPVATPPAAASAASAASAGPGTDSAAHGVATRITQIDLGGARASAAAAGKGSAGRVAILTAPTVSASFQTVGVSWRPTDTPVDLDITVRTRATRSGTWSSWTALDNDDDDGSEDPVVATGMTAARATAAGMRAGTPSLWAGGASDGVQVRVIVHSGRLPKDLRAELIDPGTSSADAVASPDVVPGNAAVSSATTGAAGATDDVSTASITEPKTYSRKAWGADESKVRNRPTYMSTIKAAVMHHTAGPNHYSKSQVPGIIRGDYAYHLSRGWSDIGYNALVDRFGRIWEGRAGGIDKNVMGAHAGGFNTDTVGVSVIGNYDTARPTAAAVEAVARIFAWKLDLNYRNPLGTTRLTSQGGGTARYKAGRTATLPTVMGHRNTGFTACPGKYLYPYLPHIRQRVKTLMRAALTNPAKSPATVTLGTPMWISARSLAAQSWHLEVTSECSGRTVAKIGGRAAAQQAFTAAWDGKLADGTLAAPGRYTLTLTSQSSTGTARPVTSTVLIQPKAVAEAPSSVPSAGAGGYVPVTPTRLTGSDGGSSFAIWPRGSAQVHVLGQAGVPASGVSSVVLNVTVNCATDGTTLEVYPTGSARTGDALTSVPAGGIRSVLVTTQVGADGSVSIINGTGVAGLTADVVGYYATGAGSPVTAVPATRILDTPTSGGALAAGEARSVPLPATIGGVPAASITAVMADVSAISPAGNGTLSAFAPGASSSLPTLPFRTGVPTDNLAMVPVINGALMVKAAGAATQVTVDVRAVVTSGTSSTMAGHRLTVIRPVQVLDQASLAAGTPVTVPVTGGTTGVPAGVTGVLAGLDAVNPTATGSFEVYQAGTTPGPGVVMRVKRGDARGTVVLVPVGPDGQVSIKVGAGTSRVRLDVRGYLS